MDHKSHEAMRAYLLGLLSDDRAATFEEEYFVNRAFFLQLQSEETALIEDYLAGRLQGEEKQRFGERYLRVPDLRSKVEKVRRQRTAVYPALRSPFWTNSRLGLMAALILIVVGTSVYYFRISSQTKSAAQLQNGSRPGSPPVVQTPALREFAIYLSPGVTKGSSSTQVHFPQPAAGDIITLILELPGESSPVQRSVQIFKLKPDGTLNKVWTSPNPMQSGLRLRPRTSFNWGPTVKRNRISQALSLPLPRSLFQSGDYLIRTSNEKMHEIYEYRVTERP